MPLSPRRTVIQLSIAAALLAGGAIAQPAAPPAAAIDWSSAMVVEVDLTNFAFSPASLPLQQGVPYRLHFVNKSSGGHDFTAKDFFEEATVDPAGQALLKNGKISLKGSETADVGVVANRVGHYDVVCSHLMHATMGMRGDIVVQ
jgi:plastocyanin